MKFGSHLVIKLNQTDFSLGLKLSYALQYVSASLCLNHKKQGGVSFNSRKNHISLAAFTEGPQRRKSLNPVASLCPGKLLAVFEKRNLR